MTLLLLLACSPADDRCNPGVEGAPALADPTPAGLTGEEALARAEAATAATLTWASGAATALAMAVEVTGDPWTCHAEPTRGDSSTGNMFYPSWHLPVRWTLSTEDGGLDVALDGDLIATAEGPDPWLQAVSADGAGIDLGEVDPAAWRDFEVVITGLLPESGATGTVFASGWQDIPDDADRYLEETLATW